MGDCCVSSIPNRNTGMATTRPASGPEMPMSTSALRFGIGSRMDMKAPKVPRGGIDGMKKGNDALPRAAWP